jgi:hypothetical protein
VKYFDDDAAPDERPARMGRVRPERDGDERRRDDRRQRRARRKEKRRD